MAFRRQKGQGHGKQSSYQRQLHSRRGEGKGKGKWDKKAPWEGGDRKRSAYGALGSARRREERREYGAKLDTIYGMLPFTEGEPRLGFLVNLLPSR